MVSNNLSSSLIESLIHIPSVCISNAQGAEAECKQHTKLFSAKSVKFQITYLKYQWS